jgi:hypothetical protein
MSNQTNPDKEQAVIELTPEQIAERKKELLEYYNGQIELLTPQLEFETLMANIEEQRFKRASIIVRHAQMMAGPEPEKEEKEAPKRPLKKD